MEGLCVLFFSGGGNGCPSNTKSPGPRPTCMPSFILIHPTVWPQYPNVIDRRTETVQTDRQTSQSDSIGRTGCYTVVEPFYKRSPKNHVKITAKLFKKCAASVVCTLFPDPYTEAAPGARWDTSVPQTPSFPHDLVPQYSRQIDAYEPHVTSYNMIGVSDGSLAAMVFLSPTNENNNNIEH